MQHSLTCCSPGTKERHMWQPSDTSLATSGRHLRATFTGIPRSSSFDMVIFLPTCKTTECYCLENRPPAAQGQAAALRFTLLPGGPFQLAAESRSALEPELHPLSLQRRPQQRLPGVVWMRVLLAFGYPVPGDDAAAQPPRKRRPSTAKTRVSITDSRYTF